MYVDGFPSWRWVDWITLIIVGLVGFTAVFFLPETHPAVIQSWKAKQLRTITNDERYLARGEIIKLTFWHRLKMAVHRPFVLAREPIVIAVTAYLTVIWCIIFTFLDGYDTIFRATYGISQGLTNTIFIAMYIGALLTIPLSAYVHYATKKELRKDREAGVETPTIRPETRLWWAMYGGSWSIPVSLFWLAWTTYVSFLTWLFAIFFDQIAYISAAFNINLGANRVHRVFRLWLADSLSVHVHVHHRRLRSQRRFSTYLLYRCPLSCLGRTGCGRCTILRKRWETLDSVHSCCLQHVVRSNSVRIL